MENPKISSSLSGLQKEKQVARDYRPDITRTASCNGDSSTKTRPARCDLSKMSRHSDMNGTTRLADWSTVSENLPSVVVPGQGGGPVEEEPLPPLEITSSSVMATIRLEGSLSDLEEAIRMYEEFDRLCRDSPAWSYYVGQQISNIRYGLRAMRHAAGSIAYLRNGGQGTVEQGRLEALAKDALAIEKEGRKEWKDTTSRFKEKDEEAKMVEERTKAYRTFVHETYAKKMKAKLGELEEAASEVDTLKQQLKAEWEDLSKLTEAELDEMEEKY